MFTEAIGIMTLVVFLCQKETELAGIIQKQVDSVKKVFRPQLVDSGSGSGPGTHLTNSSGSLKLSTFGEINPPKLATEGSTLKDPASGDAAANQGAAGAEESSSLAGKRKSLMKNLEDG